MTWICKPVSAPRILLLSLVLLGFAATPTPAGIDIDEAYPLPWSTYDNLFFFVDIATFPVDATSSRTEVYVRMPGGSLVYPDSIDQITHGKNARVRYELKLKNDRGKTVHKEKKVIQIPPPETDATGFSLGHVMLFPLALEPGWHELEIKIEDMLSEKIGLAYIGRDVHQDGKVKGIFKVPAFPPVGLVISDLQTAWSISESSRRNRFTRGRVDVIPNPSRTYGLYQPRATVYYEIQSPSGGEEILDVQTRIRDLKENVVREGTPSMLPIEGGSWSQAAFDVSGLRAGAYDLEVLLTTAEGQTVTRTTRFNVAWAASTWRVDAHEIVDEAHFLIDDEDEEEMFARFMPGEQEAYMNEYWLARDKDPTTPRNEEREKFHERVDYANLRYGLTGIQRGMFTDRGRTYIRYGPPDEILQEVMPTHGLQVEDIAKGIAETEGDEFAAPLRSYTGAGGDVRSFEVWIYDRLSSPSGQEAQDVGPRRPMARRFVFVDEDGYGNYVLLYSND